MIETDEGILVSEDEYVDIMAIAKAYLAICSNRKKIRGVVSLLSAGQFSMDEPKLRITDKQLSLRAFAKRLAHDHLGVVNKVNKMPPRADGAQ